MVPSKRWDEGMRALPPCVVQVLDMLPDAQPQKIVLNTDGKGHWEVEVFSRYVVSEEHVVPHEPRSVPSVPFREKAIRRVRQ
jgi:hypothetical protein